MIKKEHNKIYKHNQYVKQRKRVICNSTQKRTYRRPLKITSTYICYTNNKYWNTKHIKYNCYAFGKYKDQHGISIKKLQMIKKEHNKKYKNKKYVKEFNSDRRTHKRTSTYKYYTSNKYRNTEHIM